MTAPDSVLRLAGVTVEYRNRRGLSLRAVDDVSFAVPSGRTVGLVGESGSGKSTIGRAILGLVRVRAGTITFDGEDITAARGVRRRALTRHIQVVFQDPYSSLNPTKPVRDTLVEPMLAHRRDPDIAAMDWQGRIAEVLDRVGLARTAADRYPGQFSGGQRQRIAIARALMLSPKLIVCDEPVSALDLSVQAQVVNLLTELQADLGLTYLFIGHDLAVVRYVSQDVVVLRRGQIVEQGPADALYDHPAHPYTRRLLDCAPVPDPAVQRARSVRITMRRPHDSPQQPDAPRFPVTEKER